MATGPSRNARFLDGGIWKVHFALFLTQLSAAGYFVLTKAALTEGVDRFVFAVYRNLLGVALVASFAYFLEKSERTQLTPQVLGLLTLAGFTGIYGNQVFFLTGLALTSTAYAAALQIATPMFTFLIAVIFRTDDLDIRKRNGQAKLLGVFCSLSGACVMTFYQGPVVLGTQRHEQLTSFMDILSLHTPTFVASVVTRFGITAWQFGSACLVLNTLCLGVFVNLQSPILKRYPAPLSETALSMFFGWIFLVVTGLLVVQDTSAWVVTNGLCILSIVYAGTMVSGFTFALSTWCIQRSGPFLVGAYMPLQPVVSGALGLIFLGDVIYLGSVLGAILVLSGLYLITWGKVESRKELDRTSGQSVEPSLIQSGVKEPLLNGHRHS